MSLTTEPPTPYVNPEAAPQQRRLLPVVMQGILLALDAGVRQVDVAHAFGVSPTTVRRVRNRATPKLRETLEYLSEIADAERELRDTLPAEIAEPFIQAVRLGHLIRRHREAAER
jgi:hypothetical protein